jgi:hypothetical protein
MPYCPLCRAEYQSGVTTCADCGVELNSEPPPEPAGPAADEEMVPVFDAPDQMAAITVASMLEQEGIRAIVRSEQIAMFDGAAMMLRPRWGRVLAMAQDEERARMAIDEYLRSLAEQPVDDGDQPETETKE